MGLGELLHAHESLARDELADLVAAFPWAERGVAVCHESPPDQCEVGAKDNTRLSRKFSHINLLELSDS
ncbi:hypothetical protein GCM10010404_02790 [Nonomuraea africana]